MLKCPTGAGQVLEVSTVEVTKHVQSAALHILSETTGALISKSVCPENPKSFNPDTLVGLSSAPKHQCRFSTVPTTATFLTSPQMLKPTLHFTHVPTVYSVHLIFFLCASSNSQVTCKAEHEIQTLQLCRFILLSFIWKADTHWIFLTNRCTHEYAWCTYVHCKVWTVSNLRRQDFWNWNFEKGWRAPSQNGYYRRQNQMNYLGKKEIWRGADTTHWLRKAQVLTLFFFF